MKKDIEILKKEIAELTNSWKRALADYQNLEKRCREEKTETVVYANKDLIQRLLAVLDHLENVLKHLKDEGLELAVREFKKVLEDEGLQEMNIEGKAFDPREMEAIEVIEGEEEKLEVVAKGYLLKNRVIRPVKVKVFKISNTTPEKSG